MPKDVKVTRTGLVLYGIAILVVAFVGVLMGNWLIGARQTQTYEHQIRQIRQHVTALIKDGDQFPSMELIDLDSKPINALTLFENHKNLLITISPGCKPCALTIAEWQEYIDTIPSDIRIIGIIDANPGQARAYISETDFPFVMYCDTSHVLPDKYGLQAFPSVVGIDEKGRVVFVREGWLEGFTPLDAYEIFANNQ
ncbi:MAG: redoxin domain-containing protein [candidate division Zixibacteria bacterium]|nr:redoxin domain-containing protein [candidate division Zixibacteria bacterium]